MSDATTLSEPRRPVGRPSTYTPDIVDRICEAIVEGESVKSIGKREDMPTATCIMNWLNRHPEFVDQYARACEVRTLIYAREALDIADTVLHAEKVKTLPDGSIERISGDAVERSKLMVETRLKLMSALNPKRFGQKVDVNHTGQITLESLVTQSITLVDRIGSGKVIEAEATAPE
jgi:hypothetical protein